MTSHAAPALLQSLSLPGVHTGRLASHGSLSVGLSPRRGAHAPPDAALHRPLRWRLSLRLAVAHGVASTQGGQRHTARQMVSLWLHCSLAKGAVHDASRWRERLKQAAAPSMATRASAW